jgi:hypothetical protein
MARRLDIELTSVRDDGTWTWRAAGAKEPRGAIDAKLLEPGAKVGDVLRVEASIDLDGISIVSVLPPRDRAEPKDRIEMVTAPTDGTGSVTTQLVTKGRASARGRQEREGTRPRADDTRPRAGRPPRTEGSPERRRQERTARPRRPRPDAAERPEPRRRASEGREETPERQRRARPPRFTPSTKHRDEYFATLPVEQRAVAEQLARGGMPAIRRAIAESSVGHGGEAMIALAEQLLPDVRRALWLDRAEAAVGQLETISLRDLRATVVGASPRDEHGREMLATLREALNARVGKIRTTWEEEIRHALEAGRILQALRLSSRAPDAGARLPAPLARPLAEAASAALDENAPPERWLALLEAAAASPVRLSVKPVAMPNDEAGTLRHSAAVWAGRIPALAPMLGLALPPPPRPVKRAAPVRKARHSQRTAKAQPQPAPKSREERSDATGVTETPAEHDEGDPTAPAEAIELANSAPEPTADAVPPEAAGSLPPGDDAVIDEPAADTVDEIESENLS